MVLADRPGPGYGGPRVDRLEQSLQIRKRSERVSLILANAGGAVEPAPGGHIGDRVGAADDEIPSFEVVVQHLVVPFGFATIAVNRVVQTTGSGELKMHRLTRERTKAGGDEEQPGKQLRPVLRLAEELARLFGQIEQDRCRIEDPRLLAAWTVRVDDRRYLAVRVDRTEGRSVLLALAGVDGNGLIRQACLFQDECDLRGVGSRVEIEPDHGVSSGQRIAASPCGGALLGTGADGC